MKGQKMDLLPDGIYFNLDEARYHAEERLSSSGVCNMLVSPANFWKESWLNKEEGEEEEGEEDATKAQILGRAFHAARLEPEKFAANYVRDLDVKDWPGALMNGTAIEAELEKMGQAKTKKGETVLEKAQRLQYSGYTGPIWHILRAQFDEGTQGKIQIKAKYFDDIERDMVRIRANPEIAQHMTGGMAEVSIMWTDARGVKRKARMDYLKPASWTDFKTFDNSRRKELEQFIADAIRYNMYYIQMGWYWEAAEAIRIGGLKIIGNAPDEARDLIDEIKARTEPLECYYVFQEKNGIPNLLARHIKLLSDPHESHDVNAAGADQDTSSAVAAMTRKPTRLKMKADLEIRHAIGLFKFYMEEVGESAPWGPLRPTGAIDDDSFNRFWLEGNE